MPNTEIVYVLSNPAMPGIVKIGRTAAQIETECNKSLRRLGVDTIDL